MSGSSSSGGSGGGSPGSSGRLSPMAAFAGTARAGVTVGIGSRIGCLSIRWRRSDGRESPWQAGQTSSVTMR